MAETAPTTALIIGAGLSAASEFGLPTMGGFFGPELTRLPELDSFLKWFYPNHNPQAYNLEEVMSFLHLSSARLPLWRNRSQSYSSDTNLALYESLLTYTKTRLAIQIDAVCPLHRRLFESLTQQDSIISFNYDLVADNALLAIEPREHDRPGQDTRMGKISGLLGRLNLWNDPPPALMPREQTWGFYLKLHGSLDWLHCETPGCANNINIFARGVSILAEGQDEGMPCRCCGASLKTFIVPPVATKRLEDRGRMAFLWNIALRPSHRVTYRSALRATCCKSHAFSPPGNHYGLSRGRPTCLRVRFRIGLHRAASVQLALTRQSTGGPAQKLRRPVTLNVR